jgi:hypothetical protein
MADSTPVTKQARRRSSAYRATTPEEVTPMQDESSRHSASSPTWDEVTRLEPLEKLREQEGLPGAAAQSSAAEQAERDLRRWADRYEPEAHAALHKVFPDCVVPPSESV